MNYVSPWYNRNGWQDVKNQLSTHLSGWFAGQQRQGLISKCCTLSLKCRTLFFCAGVCLFCCCCWWWWWWWWPCDDGCCLIVFCVLCWSLSFLSLPVQLCYSSARPIDCAQRTIVCACGTYSSGLKLSSAVRYVYVVCSWIETAQCSTVRLCGTHLDWNFSVQYGTCMWYVVGLKLLSAVRYVYVVRSWIETAQCSTVRVCGT